MAFFQPLFLFTDVCFPMKSKDMEPFQYSPNNSLRHFVYYHKTRPDICGLKDYAESRKVLRRDFFLFAPNFFLPLLSKILGIASNLHHT